MSSSEPPQFVQGFRPDRSGLPAPIGLYDPRYEHDACGVGMVVHMKGKASHKIIQMGLEMLENMNHRGACGCEENSGDGAGIMASMPDKFFRKEAAKWGFKLPKAGEYGVAMCFLPKDLVARQEAERVLESVVKSYGMTVLGWRDVPTNENFVGPTPKTVEPRIRQCFIGMGETFYNRKRLQSPHVSRPAANRKRDRVRQHLRIGQAGFLHLRHQHQSRRLQRDADRRRSCDAITPIWPTRISNPTSPWSTADSAPTHSPAGGWRIRIATSPTTAKSTPCAATATGCAPAPARSSPKSSATSCRRCIPIITESGSDSATLDNALQFLTVNGRSLPHAVLMLIPEAWQNNTLMDPELRAFYEYHACLMEPWDGPASHRLHQRRNDRRGARSQWPAPEPLLRHQG